MVELRRTLLLLTLHLFSFPLHRCAAAARAFHNIVELGAAADGRTDSSGALLKAWELACRSPKAPGTIVVPAGTFFVGKAAFRGPCRGPVALRMEGTLVAASDYGGPEDGAAHEKWISFDGVDGLSVYGGVLDGRGAALWACKAARRSCPAGATTLTVSNSKNVLVAGLTSVDSKLYHVVIHSCRNVTVRDARIAAPASSPNTDGVHVQMSAGVTVAGSTIRTGDDCVYVGPGTAALRIERVACGPGHGISIGSLGKEPEEEGVENVTVRSVVFTGTQNGLRIKSWGRPSTAYVRGVAFQHVLMRHVENPIIIDQNYCPHDVNCPDQNSGVEVSGVKFSDVRGSSATRVAVKFDCSRSTPCRGIGLEDVELTYENRPAESSCLHVLGTASGLMIPPSCL